MKWKLRSLSILFLSFIFFNITSFADSTPLFKHIVFFGDSLSDNGNFYNHSDHLIPKYPPYYNGRFSNGYNWADDVSYTLFSKFNISSENYAVGGATAVLRSPLHDYLPVSVGMEIDDYKIRNLLSNKDDTLYCIWIGGNDYLQGASDVNQTTTDVVNAIIDAIQSLASYKNAQFLVISMPYLPLTPQAKIKQLVDNYKQLVTMHNQKLHAAILKLRTQYPTTKIIEFNFSDHQILRQLVASQTYRDHINKKYDINITNVSDPCWTGGLTQPSTNTIEQTLRNTHSLNNNQHSVNTHMLAQQIADNPALFETYRVGQLAAQGNLECAHPEQYVFWDNVHPTAVTHKILGAMMLDEILKNQ